MALEIKGAPASGWYLSVGPDAADRSLYLWTGMAQLHGKHLKGYVVEVLLRGKEFRFRAEWRSEGMVRGLARVSIPYERVETLPDVWLEDICEAAKRCEAEVEKYRALIERLEQENQAR